MTKCFLCLAPITGSSGFLLARDWVELANGTPVLKRARVFCGRCAISGAADKWLRNNPNRVTEPQDAKLSL
jgi:hypothetical protein